MKVRNIHSRVISQPKVIVKELFYTLASKNDKIWPVKKWPRMKFKEGLVEGAVGGHGPIRYSIQQYIPGEFIRFKFLQPSGFDGIHQLELIELAPDQTEIKHNIEMNARGIGILSWSLGIRWLHDALIEDAFDQVENHFSKEQKTTEWNWWVKLLRYFLE